MTSETKLVRIRYGEQDEMDKIILAIPTLSQKEKDRLKGRSCNEYGEIIFDHAWSAVEGSGVCAVEFESNNEAYQALRLSSLGLRRDNAAIAHVRFEQDLGAIEFTSSPDISAVGTALVGYLFAAADTIRRCFGEGRYGDNYAVDLEWRIRSCDRTITIYNYKNGSAYQRISGNKAIPVSKMRKWHIGSVDEDAVDIIYSIMTNQGRKNRCDFLERQNNGRR